MAKTYFNNAVIGNSSMLGCLTDKGELVRLFWPNIDYPQHIEKMVAGVFFSEIKGNTIWINEGNWSYNQSYIKDTNILETVCTNYEKGLHVSQTDFVLPEKDILVRRYEIQNIGPYRTELGFVLYSSGISTTPELRSILFDFGNDALIHYRHNYYISISADKEVFQFQLGNDAFASAFNTELRGYDSIGMMPDGAVSWKLGKFEPGEAKQITISICAANTLKGVKELIRSFKSSDVEKEYIITNEFWKGFLKNARKIETGNSEIDNLYKRSLLVFKLMSDKKTGGLLAAPEIDEGFTKCGRYAYCWGRDAAFITSALDKSGLNEAVDKFYEWAVNIQDDDGSWQQRYHLDGNLAPSWGLQVDETGTLIWGMLEHYKVTGDKEFLIKMWESVKKGVEFLLGFIDSDTGLPKHSYDIWEERFGEHIYSSAAVYGGVKSAVEIASILQKGESIISRWTDEAEAIKKAIEINFWKEEHKCFIRSIRTKLNPWGSEHSGSTTFVRVNPKGYFRDVTLEDWTTDVSILGISIPFDVFGVNDLRVKTTVDNMERVLKCAGTGGIKRYENDSYIGGNPWVLTTLWVGLYYARRKDYDTAFSYLEWAVKCRTELDLLPEQVSAQDGKPAWVIPLTWSHAMFVLLLLELAEADAIETIDSCADRSTK